MQMLRCLLLALLSGVLACNAQVNEAIVKTDRYELRIARAQKVILVLFPCFSCDIDHTKREAFFLKDIENKGVTTLLLREHSKLYLMDAEKTGLANELKTALRSNGVKSAPLYLGGFSSGGNLALLLGNYLAPDADAYPLAGVFAVDAPVDLERLYYNALYDVASAYQEDAKNEGLFISNLLEKALGNPAQGLQAYRQYSPFLGSENFTDNLNNHRKFKIRLYTEPALDWQWQYRKRTYEHTNAFALEKLYECLKNQGNTTCDLIKTAHKGKRANGEVHPHSWSIVEQQALVDWLFE